MTQMLSLGRQPRNRVILRLLYLGGLRISEVCQLKGRDLQPRDDAGQVTVFGKGGKTRVGLLTPSIWADLAALRGDDPDAAVFRSRKGGGHPDPVQVHILPSWYDLTFAYKKATPERWPCLDAADWLLSRQRVKGSDVQPNLRRRTAARPINPPPKSASEAGSGTGTFASTVVSGPDVLPSWNCISETHTQSFWPLCSTRESVEKNPVFITCEAVSCGFPLFPTDTFAVASTVPSGDSAVTVHPVSVKPASFIDSKLKAMPSVRVMVSMFGVPAVHSGQ